MQSGTWRLKLEKSRDETKCELWTLRITQELPLGWLPKENTNSPLFPSVPDKTVYKNICSHSSSAFGSSHKCLYALRVKCDDHTTLKTSWQSTGGQWFPGPPTGSSHKQLVCAVRWCTAASLLFLLRELGTADKKWSSAGVCRSVLCLSACCKPARNKGARHKSHFQHF